jgi:hypothetical protein
MSDSANKNRALWDRVCVTDPRAVKQITGKQYSGNSPKPYWIVERLTEEFGPCGKGWGFTILNERMERLTETDVLHVAVVRFWYVSEGSRCELEQIGQTKAVYKTSKGGLLVDEDAPKKSVTDALVKCASYIGFAGDIFSGRWDDSKYVAWARDQYTEPEPAKPASPIPDTFRSSPTMGAMDEIADEERKTYLELLGSIVIEKVKSGEAAYAYQKIQAEKFDDSEATALWSLLDSKTRAALKKHKETITTKEPA